MIHGGYHFKLNFMTSVSKLGEVFVYFSTDEPIRGNNEKLNNVSIK